MPISACSNFGVKEGTSKNLEIRVTQYMNEKVNHMNKQMLCCHSKTIRPQCVITVVIKISFAKKQTNQTMLHCVPTKIGKLQILSTISDFTSDRLSVLPFIMKQTSGPINAVIGKAKLSYINVLHELYEDILVKQVLPKQSFIKYFRSQKYMGRSQLRFTNFHILQPRH